MTKPGQMRPGETVPSTLMGDSVCLRFNRILPGDSALGLAPAYHFRILTANGEDVGHINFRVGESSHVLNTAGHVGFAVQEEHRGCGYALAACRALAPFVREHYEEVILTADPENHPSRRTIERLGAVFLGEVAVPSDDPGYAGGARRKARYAWTP